VQAAKTAATGKGAKAVGALKSEDFSSLSGSDYVIYSGVYHKRSEAETALPALKKSFPSAAVIEVSNGSSSSSSEGSGGSTSGGAGSSINHPAPPSVLEGLKSVKGKGYEEKSGSPTARCTPSLDSCEAVEWQCRSTLLTSPSPCCVAP
jgi:hypothetical protein